MSSMSCTTQNPSAPGAVTEVRRPVSPGMRAGIDSAICFHTATTVARSCSSHAVIHLLGKVLISAMNSGD